MKRRILLIDFYNMFIRNFMMVPVSNEDTGDHLGGIYGSLRSIKNAIDVFRPNEVYVVMDGPNSALRRKMIDKDYKSHRSTGWKKGRVKAYDFLNENDETDSFTKQVKRLSDYFGILPVKFISIPYVEADDVIAEIARIHGEENKVVIYSSDSDYRQLITDNIACFNPMNKVFLNKKWFVSKFGFLPENYIYLKVVTGDKSDNISGIRGIGEKTFLKMFPVVATSEINGIDGLVAFSQRVIETKSKDYTKAIKNKHKLLLENVDLLVKNYRLMQLHDVNISLQAKMACKNAVESEPNEFSRMKLRNMLVEDRLNIHVKNVAEWSRSFTGLVASGRKR